jgi:hypothetical protein
VLAFVAILVGAFLSPRYIGLHCPSFARYCSDGLVLGFSRGMSPWLRFYLPATIGCAALLLLIAAFPLEHGPRSRPLVAATIVFVGTVVALTLPWAIVPDPIRCVVIPPGPDIAGGIGCGVEGGHPDPRLALRYFVLLGALVSAGALFIERTASHRVPAIRRS